MQPVAVRATPIAALDRPVILRVTIASVVLGLLMSFVGAFQLNDDPPLVRTAWIVAASLIGAVFDLVAYQAALAVPWARTRFWARVAIAAAIAGAAMSLIILASLWMFGRQPPLLALPIAFLNAFVVGGAFIAAIVAPAMDAAVRRAGAEPFAPSVAGSAGFVDRLPARLRGGELWALQSEDHYVRVHTSRGEALLRLRMADALRELASIQGAQTHRS